MRISGHGLSIDAPDGWEARIFTRPGGGAVLHLATFALQARDGDYGAAATGRMGGDDIFLALLEFRRDDRIPPGVGLFEARGRPQPVAREFRDNQLQVTRAGQLGWQRFYTEGEQPSCIYAVVTPARRSVAQLVATLAVVLSTFSAASASSVGGASAQGRGEG